MPRLHAARALMVMMLLLATLLLGFPAGRGLGAVSHAGQPTLGEVQQELDQCRSGLANLRADLPTVAAQLKKAKAGTLVLAALPDSATAIPVDVKAWRALITLDLAEGSITQAQHDHLEAQIKVWQASTLASLEGMLNGAPEAQRSLQERCAALERQRNQLLGGGTLFKLVPGLTKVVNTHSTEMTIDPAAASAHDKHCCDGGGWDVTYTWKVPETVVLGTKYPVEVGIQVNKVNPEQPLGLAIAVLAPDFAQSYSIEYPHAAGGSTTFDIPVASDQSGAKEYSITVGFNGSSVTYTYQP